MTTAMEGLDKARSFFLKRLTEMDEEDRAAVIELLQIANSEDCEDPEEVLATLSEIVFPDSLADQLEHDEADQETKRRVAEYRYKVGEAIRLLRQSKKLSQIDLAEMTGLPQSHISRLERGRHAATYVTIQRIAEALGTTPSQIDPGFEN